MLGYANFLEGKLTVFDTALFHGTSGTYDLAFVRKFWTFLDMSASYFACDKFTGTEVREAADSISTYPSLDFHVSEPKKNTWWFRGVLVKSW